MKYIRGPRPSQVRRLAVSLSILESELATSYSISHQTFSSSKYFEYLKHLVSLLLKIYTVLHEKYLNHLNLIRKTDSPQICHGKVQSPRMNHSSRDSASPEPELEGWDTLLHRAAIPCFSLASREGVRPLGSRDAERERILPAPPRPEDSNSP
jgi:hypothetical protein